VEELGEWGQAWKMTLEIQPVTFRRDLQFPIMLKVMTDKETKEYHLKKLYELSLKWREKNPPEKPNKKRDRFLMEIARNGWRFSK
jgi:hypothetical protein